MPELPPLNDRSTRNGFAGATLDRQSENRAPDCLETARRDPQARLYLFNGDRLVFPADQPSPALQIAIGEALGMVPESLIYLGRNAAGPVLAAATTIDAPPREEAGNGAVISVDLRSHIGTGNASAQELGEIAYGRSLVDWHQNHQFCARCGAKSASVDGGVRRDCPSCGRQHFPRVDPVAIMLIIDDQRCLLGRGPHFQPGMYSCLAGFVEPGETVEAAVQRETFEESGIRCTDVRYHSSQPWPFASSLMIGAHARAVSTELNVDRNELEDVRWFEREEVAQMAAGTHPEGLRLPPEFAIARRIIESFLDGETL